jgi:predicted kinase
MTVPPTVYDCIEFEPRFRIGDVATEIAFLVMDLRYRGAGDLARSFTAAYGSASGDHELPTLLPTLCAYRAMVRAKVAVVAAAAPELPAPDRDHAVDSAHRHLELAAALLAEAGGPWWVVIFGPPASGKSTLARALATSTDWPQLATDVVRKRLAGLAPTERGPAAIYSEQFTRDTYRELQQQAAAATAGGARVVLLDGNFPRATDRHQVAAGASAVGARCLFVHVDLDRATAIARAAERATDDRTISDADAAVAAARHDRFERPTAAGTQPLVVIDGTQPPAVQRDAVLAALLAAADMHGH